MRRFVIRSFVAAGLFLAVDVAIIVTRIAHAQGEVASAFAVPPGTVAVFIGNSHTGCTFTEAPEFSNRVVWHSATGFALHYLRFIELERRGAFGGDVKACVVDCDVPSLLRCARKWAMKDFRDMLPMTWRYWDRTLLTNTELASEVLSHPDKGFSFRETPPPDVPSWAMRPSEERRERLKTIGADVRRFRMTDVASDEYPNDWQARLLEMIRDMKARCDRHGVRLILFASPLASDSPERTNPNAWTLVSEFAARVRELGVEYCDFRAACADEEFWDAGHLLRSSSYEFTKRFYAEVLKIPVGN